MAIFLGGIAVCCRVISLYDRLQGLQGLKKPTGVEVLQRHCFQCNQLRPDVIGAIAQIDKPSGQVR